jgi:branched-subunit amino acid transport protein
MGSFRLYRAPDVFYSAHFYSENQAGYRRPYYFRRYHFRVPVDAAWQHNDLCRWYWQRICRRFHQFKATMNLPLLFVISAATTFAWRYMGFALKVTQASPFWERFLRLVPISIFTALVLSGLYKDIGFLRPEIIALTIAGIVAWRTCQFGVSVISGLMALWGLALLGLN